MRINKLLGYLSPTVSSGLPSALQDLFSFYWSGEYSGDNPVDSRNGKVLTVTNKDWSGSEIPYTSSATLALPNEAAFKADDKDGAFFTDAGVVRQVPVNYLINNDYTRILVRYSHESPYQIEWIGLLDDSVTPTSDQWNQLHLYFGLHVFWSGVWNDYGYFKDNKPLDGFGYKGWEAIVSEQSLTLPSDAVRVSLNKLCLYYINESIFSGFDRLWIWMLNDPTLISGAGTVSLINPYTTRLTFPVAPTYSNSGIKGNGTTQYALSNFNPSTQGVNYTLNNATVGTYVYDAGNNGHFVGGSSFTVWLTGANCRVNSGGFPAINFNGTGYTAASRNAASGAGCLLAYKETTQTSLSNASISISTAITFLQSSGSFSTSGLSMGFVGRNFTQAEHLKIRQGFLDHKTRLGL